MLWIVKLGGSLYDAPQLREWTSALAAHWAGRVVVVPGGGPYADQVRAAQRLWQFDDGIAHRMALLAMDQFGMQLCGLGEGLVPVQTPADMPALLQAGQIPVWLPAQCLTGNPAIPESWDISSDSIALWLAGILAAQGLLLVKSAIVPPGVHHVAAMRSSGVVDAAFGRLPSDVAEVRLAHRNDAARLGGPAWPDWPIHIRF